MNGSKGCSQPFQNGRLQTYKDNIGYQQKIDKYDVTTEWKVMWGNKGYNILKSVLSLLFVA